MRAAELKRHLVTIGVMVVALCLMAWRSFQGFDWTDETYYAAISYRIVQGDAMFQTSWDIHQLSGMLESPLVWVFVLVTGGTTGIILYLRLVYVLIACGVFVVAYAVLQRDAGRVWAIIASALPVVCMNPIALSYNTMQLLSFFVAFALLVLSIRLDGKHRAALLVLSGFASGTGVIAYPTTIFALLVFAAAIMFEPGFGGGAKARFLNLLPYAAGGFLCLLLLLVFLLADTSFDAIARNWQYLFLDPGHYDHVFSLKGHFLDLAHLLGRTLMASIGGLFVLAVVANKVVKGKTQRILALLILVALLIVVVVQLSRCLGGFSQGSIQFKIFFAVATVMPVLFALNGFKWHYSIWLFLLGMTLSISVNMATNNKVDMWIYPYALSAAATAVYLSSMCEFPLCVRRVLQCSMTIVVAIAAASCFCYVYRDAPLGELDAQLGTGPGAGLYTTHERSEEYSLTMGAIETNMPHEGNVLYVKLLPFGYLSTEALSASPRLWTTNLDYPLFGEYYEENPDKLPDAIYIVNEDYAVSNNDLAIGDYFECYIAEHDHRIVECEAATIILFEEPFEDSSKDESKYVSS